MTTSSPYALIAEAYARHWGPSSAVMMLPVLQRVLLPRLEPGARVLDLCCGTGDLARRLQALGHRVTGVDGTPELVELARRAGGGVELAVADAESFRRPEGFEAITCLYDSLNHLSSEASLARVLSNCHASLVHGGWLVFDLNEEAGFQARWRGEFSIIEDDLVLVARSRYQVAARTGRMAITLVMQREGVWQRRDTHFEEVCFDAPRVLELLTAAGFSQLQKLAADGDLGLTREVGRTFFIAQKVR
jgi:SAM-dependent methyltransferase